MRAVRRGWRVPTTPASSGHSRALARRARTLKLPRPRTGVPGTPGVSVIYCAVLTLELLCYITQYRSHGEVLACDCGVTRVMSRACRGHFWRSSHMPLLAAVTCASNLGLPGCHLSHLRQTAQLGTQWHTGRYAPCGGYAAADMAARGAERYGVHDYPAPAGPPLPGSPRRPAGARGGCHCGSWHCEVRPPATTRPPNSPSPGRARPAQIARRPAKPGSESLKARARDSASSW
jgi:hypothetical protein